MVYDLRALALDSQLGTLSPVVVRDCTGRQAEDPGLCSEMLGRPSEQNSSAAHSSLGIPWGGWVDAVEACRVLRQTDVVQTKPTPV